MQSLTAGIGEGIGSVGLAGLLVYAVLVRVGPLRLLTRCVDNTRAAVYLLGEMARGAWERRNRWRECLERARMER